MKSWEQFNDKIIKLSITWKCHDNEISGVYAPTDNMGNHDEEALHQRLSHLIDNIGGRKEVVQISSRKVYSNRRM